MSSGRVVGTSVKRKEDPRLITGSGRFIDDITLPKICFASFVRSPYAHAWISRIDTKAAINVRGVLAVLTGRDLSDGSPKAIPTSVLPSGSTLPSRYPLALEEISYVGEPVAVVIADDMYVARDASEMVDVEYDPLESVTDLEKALEPGSPKVHKNLPHNLVYHNHVVKGDPEKGFREADIVVKEKMVIERLAPVSLETRGIIACYEKVDDFLTIWSSNQAPHIIRTWYANYLGFPENRVRVIAPDVGGGFGAKCQLYSDEIAICMAAIKLGRPVKWIQTRMEDLLTTIHARQQVHYIELAVKWDGKIVGLRDRIVFDCGANLHFFTLAMPRQTTSFITGNYDIRNIDIEVRGTLTNKMSIDAYRGAGVPQANFVIERMMDEAARSIDIDPAEIRIRNFIRPEQFPYTNASGVTYDTGKYEEALRRALERINYYELRGKQKGTNKKAGSLMGVGLASYVLEGGFGPSKSAPTDWGGYESAKIRVDSDGKVTVYTGTSPHGQGVETVLAQVVVDELQVAIDDVVVIHGDTESIPYGIGTHGSRSAVVGGLSVLKASEMIKRKAMTIASHLLEARIDDIIFEEGRFHVQGTTSTALTLKDIAREATFMKNLPPDIEPVLEATAFYEPEASTVAFGTHAAVVAVDEETGRVEIRDYVGFDDCGRVLNPMIVEGQMHGGIVQGIGEALYEEMRYDENGQLITSTLADYSIPSAPDAPFMVMDRTETPTNSRLGVKGIGEAGTVVAVATIANAIADALRSKGARITSVPLKSEVVWRCLRGSD